MRALTIWQPWATLIISRAKHFETRSYRCRVGECAIHAAAKQDFDSLALCRSDPFRAAVADAGCKVIGDLPFGAVLGWGLITACHRVEAIRDELSDEERAFGDFRDGRYAWEFRNVIRFAEPCPARGKQGFWQWDETDSVDPYYLPDRD